MNGYGRRGGGGRGMAGWGAGRGGFAPAGRTPAGYSYVGSCRCGFGPNAYYQDSSGQIVPAGSLFSGTGRISPTQPAGEVERLRAEKADLERRIRDMEERLTGTP